MYLVNMSELTSVERSFTILRELIVQEKISVTELSEEIDIPVSTVYDHLSKLNELGYIVQKDGGYQPSTRILELAENHRRSMDIYQQAKSQLQDMTSQTGELATLMIEENGLGTLLYTTESENDIKFSPPPGSRLKLHRTGEGKAILAHLPEDRMSDIIEQLDLDTNYTQHVGSYTIPPKTEATITNKQELREELNEIQEQGYAFGREELIEGLRSIGTPVISDNGAVLGAIGIYSPVNKLDDKTFYEDFPDVLLHKSNIIEVNINYS